MVKVRYLSRVLILGRTTGSSKIFGKNRGRNRLVSIDKDSAIALDPLSTDPKPLRSVAK